MKYFFFALVFLCLAYLGIEFTYNANAMFTVDEFWFAHRAYQYKDLIPYRDFAPYKTVIGYYLLLIPMLAAKGIIGTLVFTKNMLAVLNAVILFCSAIWMTRFFAKNAVLTSLALVIFSDITLSYSTNIRVDLLAYWFGFISFLFLLDKRYILSGLLLGIAFATSQKVIWYLFASNCALGMNWLCFTRNKKTLLEMVRFNLSTLCIIGLYILCWSLVSNHQAVINSLFKEAAAMYQLDWYNQSRQLFWALTLKYNPLLFILWPLTLISLIVASQKDARYQQRCFVIVYCFAILLCLIPYKQVFPYYMQVTIPVFFLLYASFFDWLYSQQQSISAATVSILVLGVFYALTLFTLKLINTNGAYQKQNILTAAGFLEQGGDYIAGVDFIYNTSQPINGMKHLMAPAVGYLYTPTEKLRRVMLSSLDEDPSVTPTSIMHDLDHSNVKLYINNYRIQALPIILRTYLDQHFAHLWGSIYIYAPTVKPGNHSLNIKFSGDYTIESQSSVIIDKKTYSPNVVAFLHSGTHVVKTSSPTRIKFIPSEFKDYQLQPDQWAQIAY